MKVKFQNYYFRIKKLQKEKQIMLKSVSTQTIFCYKIKNVQ
jgi:hypothetical protein